MFDSPVDAEKYPEVQQNHRFELIGHVYDPDNEGGKLMGVVALMDGDAYAFKSAIAVEKETYWGDGLWTLHSYLDDAQAVFNQMLYEIREAYEAETGKTIDKMIFCFTDANNFRKELNP